MSIWGQKPLTIVIPALSLLALAACAGPPAGKPGIPSTGSQSGFTPPSESYNPTTPGTHTPTLTELGGDPRHFEGLDGKEVLAALGDPNFRRRDKPAEIWQYYGPGCILDLFLYDDKPRASPTSTKPVEGLDLDGKVVHAELRGRENQPAEVACLSRLITQRHPPVS